MAVAKAMTRSQNSDLDFYKRDNSGVPESGRLTDLESLVDELVKDTPAEEQIHRLMKSAGLQYQDDSVGRLTEVLAALDILRASDEHPLKTVPRKTAEDVKDL